MPPEGNKEDKSSRLISPVFSFLKKILLIFFEVTPLESPPKEISTK